MSTARSARFSSQSIRSGEGARLRVLPELADAVGTVEVGQHEEVEKLGAARDGGRLDPWNVRLGHVLCNRYDYGWRVRIRTMLEKGKSLEAIAEGLNRKGIRRPHGSPRWTAASVRQALVS
jgi:Recombinase